MSTQLATQPNIPAFALPEGELIATLESSLYPGGSTPSIKMVIGYCKAQHLDPFQKPVHIVPMSVKMKGEYVFRDVIMPGIGLYRVQAVRTGAYAGIDEAVFGPDVTVKLDKREVTFPEWCAIVVYRMVEGQRVPFSSGRVYWLETYSTQKRDTKDANAMWTKRPRGQLEKCAEAMALRRAFPELGAAPTAEELEGKILDRDEEGPDAPKAIVEPKAKIFGGMGVPESGTNVPKEGTVVDAECVDEKTAKEPAKEPAKEEAKPASKPAAKAAPTGPDLASAGLVKMIKAFAKEKGQDDELGAKLTGAGYDIDALPKAYAGELLTWLKGL